jgi:uncharacterized protein (DUF488 family)
MSLAELFTIGHSNRTIDEFVSLLQKNGVTAVADVRSSPYSRHSSQFNREALEEVLRANDIAYVFLGEELGARRREPECYVNGVAQYERISQTEAFQRGLNRIRRGVRSHRIALMCAEADPITCHRMILVSRYLKDEYHIVHIVDAQQNLDQVQAERRLLDVVDVPTRHLFQSAVELIDEAYERQSSRIAYHDDSQQASTSH